VNKIVLIGPYFSESKDLFNVSIAEPGTEDKNLMYGVELHANALQTLIHQNYLSRIPAVQESLLIILLSFITFTVVTWMKSIKSGMTSRIEILAVIVSGGMIYAIITIYYSAFASLNHHPPRRTDDRCCAVELYRQCVSTSI
jgi:CHASE2 domain-containing sensor protein